MSEFKLQSPPRQRVHLYVNPYTHDYEITDIPTKYQVQHIGYYVGSFFSYHHLAEKDVFHSTSYEIMDQSALDKRYGEDGKRTNICFTCNKAGQWAKNGPDKEKQTATSVFVYVDPCSHELKILPTMRLAHQFQNMKYVGILKSFCNKYKINSPLNTISVMSQTKNMQNDNTSVSDSEISQTAERLERLAESLNNPKPNQCISLFKTAICEPVRKNQINSHQQKDLSPSEEKEQDSKDKKKTVINKKSMEIKYVQIY